MGERENTIELAKSYLDRGKTKLTAAHLLLEKQLYDDSISRAYYAAFLGTKGLLMLMGETTKSHSGVVTLFGLKVVKAGYLDRKYAKILTELSDARQKSDYQPLIWFTEEDAQNLLNNAIEYLDNIKELFKQFLNSS